MKRTLLALCSLALAAAPVLAGPVYLPGASHVTDGAYVRSTELWVTNPDTAVQGFVVRFLSGNTNGTLRVAGDEITLLVDQRVWDKVGQNKARLGVNLLLGESLYSRVGGDEERYWRLYNRWQSQMWRVEQR